VYKLIIFRTAQKPPSRPGPPHYRNNTITLKHTKHYRTPLEEWSARRSYFYPKTHNTHQRHILASGGIRTRITSNRATSDPGLW